MFLRRVLLRVLRFAFQLFYNPFAFTYDPVSAIVSLGRWRAWTRVAIPRIQGARVLEVPCGTGNLLLDLRAAGYAPVGVDLSASMLKITRGKLQRPSTSSSTRSARSESAQDAPLLARARAEALPFSDGAFDSVVMTFPPGFIYDPEVFVEIRRMLDDRGRLIWVDAARFVSRGLWGRLVNRWIGFGGSAAESERLMARVLARAGFESNIEWVGDDVSVVAVAVAQVSEQ
ncbi:MAG: methyltransferase domain-containing protein [Chloroflexota bacterium]|nr:methyltransferase domain-containing protein [Chloroflexota bacterium]